MSSYVSSSYYIEHARLRNIEHQCQRELEDALARVRAGKKEMERELQNLKNRELQKSALERERRNTAAEELVTEALRKKYDAQRAEQLLEDARLQVEDYERTFGTHTEFRERLQMQRDSFAMFGATGQFFLALEQLVTHDLPADRKRLTQERESARLTQRVEQLVDEHVHTRDQSARFVSLKQENEEGGQAEKSPWERFLARVVALKQIQEEFQETGAEELLEEANRQSAAGRNRFLLRNMERLQEMEAEYADLRRSISDRQESVARVYEEYLGICYLCREPPTLTEASSRETLERECERLREQYQRMREQQYITNAFTEVFEKHGISFESMETDAHGGLRLAYQIDEQAGIRVTRSGSGAFEMQFSGHSASAQASLDEKRQAAEKAHGFCAHLLRIFEELKQRGVVFDQMMMKEPDEETIRMEQRKTASGRREVEKRKAMSV